MLLKKLSICSLCVLVELSVAPTNSSPTVIALWQTFLPPGSPTGPLTKEMPISRAFLYVSPTFPSKSSPDRKISPFSRSPLERSILSMFPTTGPLWKKTPISRALTYPSGSPIKEASICLSKSLVMSPPSRFPNWASVERDVHFKSLPLHILQGPK